MFDTTFEEKELGNSEVVSEWIYNLTFDRENLFDKLYLASYVINHYVESSKVAYESVAKEFS